MDRLRGRKGGFALLAGLLAASAMPGLGAWPFVFVALVPLFFAIEGKRGFAAGWLFGIALHAVDLRWVLTLYRFSPLVIPGLILLVLYLGLFFAALGLILSRFTRSQRIDWRFVILAAAVATLLEIARAHGPLGIGFSALYLPLYRVPILIQISAYLGPWSITAIVVAINASFYLALRHRKIRDALVGLGMVGVLAAFALIPNTPSDAPPLRVASILSRVEQERKLDGRNLEQIADHYIDLGEQAAAESPDLVVFPESILPAFILQQPELLNRFTDLAKRRQVTLLLGTGDYRSGDIFNTVVLISPTGVILGTYDMVCPVPFGEYIPGRRLWEAIGLGRLTNAFLPRDLTPGTRYEPIAGIGTPICFESTFPAPARGLVANGARLLVVVTNDAWFVGSSELDAHFATAVFRAVEMSRYVIQSANGGVSGIIDPRGNILDSTKTEGVIVADVAYRDVETPYSRWGDIPLLALLGIGVVGVVCSGWIRRKREGE